MAVLVLGSCSDNNEPFAAGEGRVFVSATLNSDVKVYSRSDLDDLRDGATLWISNEKGVIYQFASADEIPAEGLRLLADNYVAEVWAGDSVGASFTSRYFHGVTPFTVAAGDNKAVEVKAKIANTVVEVAIDESVYEALSDVSMTVGHSCGSLTFADETLDQRGYFMMNSRDKDLEWTLTGTALNGTPYSRTGKIEACQPATLYKITVKCNEGGSELGGAYFEIVIDDSAIEVVDQIEIKSSPVIRGLGFDLKKVQRAAAGEMGRKSIWISATADIVGLELASPLFESRFSVPGGNFDFRQLDETVAQPIIDAGINYYYNLDPETGQATLKLNFEEVFTNTLPDGQTDIAIKVTDSNGKSSQAVFSMLISSDPVTAQPVKESDVWATKTTLKAVINKAGVSDVHILYRQADTADWTDADAVTTGNEVSASLTGLTPGTAYEWCAQAGDFQTVAQRFTTEAALQVPNSSFETWSEDPDDKAILPGADASFWDTGNHGSITMSKNITESSTDFKHSGEKSARLKSQFVGMMGIGKFAAGNIFAGNYLRTDGTDGELGWGRPFASRPTAVKAWVRYEPGTVASGNNKGSGSHLSAGSTDKGTIYVAIVDGTVSKYEQSNKFNGTEWPVIVKTKSSNRQLFDKSASNVLGYGQVIFDKATDGNGMVEVTIPIEYVRTDAKGVYLIFVASASLYGDYFEGGEGSTLYLDDVTFIYE